MKKVCSQNDIKTAEKKAMESVSENVLIERAGKAMFDAFTAKYSRTHTLAVLVGGGNNGADGLTFARYALDAGYAVHIYLVTAKQNEYVRERVAQLVGRCKITAVTNASEIQNADIYIDSITGTGFYGKLRDNVADIVRDINTRSRIVVAVDIPSGLDAQTGSAVGETIMATDTYTFIAYKLGQIIGHGRNYCGHIEVIDIEVDSQHTAEIITEADTVMPNRAVVSHKGEYGRTYIIAGSPTMIGGAKLAHSSAVASLRSGAGYAVLCVPQSLAHAYQSEICEEMLYLMSDTAGKLICNKEELDNIAQQADVVVIGMGMGSNSELIHIIKYLCTKPITLVIDADGLNAIARDMSVLKGAVASVIITPHIGEFNRLCGGEWDGKIDSVKQFARRYNLVIALKSSTTIITDGDKVYLNTTGTPAMAKAGSGDVLSGMIGGLALKLSRLEATYFACYYFGRAGERVSSEKCEHSVIASDIVQNIKLCN